MLSRSINEIAFRLTDYDKFPCSEFQSTGILFLDELVKYVLLIKHLYIY